MKVCLEWGFGKCKREFVQACVCTSINQKIFPGFFKKNSHPPTCCHITPDPPVPPWSMLLPNACRHPNRNGCFFWRPFQAKRCSNIELGERGHASFFAMSLTGWLLFLKNPDSVRENFLVYKCANTSLNKFPFAFAKTSLQTHFHLQSVYPANKEAQNLSLNRGRFFGLWMCKHKLEQTPFCICQNLTPNTLSSSKRLPSKQRSTKFIFLGLWLCNAGLNKFPFARAKTQSKHTFIFTVATHKQRMFLHTSRSRLAQTACFAVHVQCTYSARTVHGTLHAAVHGHKTL